MGKRTKRHAIKRTEDNQKLHDEMMSRSYQQEKEIIVNGQRVVTTVTVCPAFDPRAIAGFESGDDLAKLFNIARSPGKGHS
jgi:hypothetical protein